jgi:hypothetical protein
MSNWQSVPVPPQMAHLPRDPRGFPIFVMAYRDDDGRAHFTINEEPVRQRVIRRDLCSICGRGLLRGRWFVGGEKSAFHPRGAYIDPPMHSVCAHYALRVCPYLAAPTYATPIAGKTVAGRSDDVRQSDCDHLAVDRRRIAAGSVCGGARARPARAARPGRKRGMIIHNVRDGRLGWIGSFEVEPLVYDALGPEHIGRTVVYQDYGRAEAGTLTSWRNGIVFARYSRGDTSAGANAANLSLAVEKREDVG